MSEHLVNSCLTSSRDGVLCDHLQANRRHSFPLEADSNPMPVFNGLVIEQVALTS